MTLALSGAPWEDVRYPMALASSGFSYGPEFRQDAETGAFDINMGSLPLLQVVAVHSGDQGAGAPPPPPPHVVANLGQSHSIAKFVAAEHGMAGRDFIEQAKIDAIYESCRDIKSEWFRTKRKPGGKAAWFRPEATPTDGEEEEENGDETTSLAVYCQRLEKAVVASCPHPGKIVNSTSVMSSPWCLGGPEPTLADVAIYHMLGTPKPSVVTGTVPSFFDGESDRVRQAYPQQECPRLLESVSAFGELSSIVEWETNRPETFT